MNTTQTPEKVIEEINNMVTLENGHKVIALGNYALDFKKSFAFLGLTKNKNQVILGDIHSYGAVNEDGKTEIKYKKRYAKIELVHSAKVEYTGTKGNYVSKSTPYSYWQIHTDGFRYSETIMEIEN